MILQKNFIQFTSSRILTIFYIYLKNYRIIYFARHIFIDTMIIWCYDIVITETTAFCNKSFDYNRTSFI